MCEFHSQAGFLQQVVKKDPEIPALYAFNLSTWGKENHCPSSSRKNPSAVLIGQAWV